MRALAPRRALSGIAAIGVKELRGRMRGRRAFVILTVYLVLLGAFAAMMQVILEREVGGGTASGAAFASAQVGRGVFAALIKLQTRLVIALAPAFTAGSISMEREKQTLDLLATTPISSLAIVLGKLLSALTYVFILIGASIPLTAIVFVFGGVAPDDVVRGYAVLVATTLGLGTVGLFWSALLKRTQAATVATYFTVLAVTAGTFFVFYFWNTVTGGFNVPGGQAAFGPIRGRPPEALHYLNPYFAQADVVCGAYDGIEYGDEGWCRQVAFVSNRANPDFVDVPAPSVPVPGVAPGGGIPDVGFRDVAPVPQPFGAARDGLWPKISAAWLVVSMVLVVASVQLVSPTRRWRPRILRPVRGRLPRRASST